MSLRAKLYSGFFGMVFLTLVVGGIAVWVFSVTASNLANFRGCPEYRQ